MRPIVHEFATIRHDAPQLQTRVELRPSVRSQREFQTALGTRRRMQFHRTMTAALAIGALAVVPFVAAAQTAPAAPPPQGPPPQGSPAQTVPQVQTGTGVTTKAGLGQLASALTNIDTQTSTIKSMTNVPISNIQLVNAADLAKGKNAGTISGVVVKKDAQIQSLRQALAGVSVTDSANGNQNLTFTTALGNLSTAQKLNTAVTLDRVIAVDSSASGALTVFYI
ncbi:MAG: hypothetical protein JWO66_1720 [Candidatus Eremiobacteraeota bacterium]|nr:hypothetical protein [Candidatus Eremiobacteraeota bacterium]